MNLLYTCPGSVEKRKKETAGLDNVTERNKKKRHMLLRHEQGKTVLTERTRKGKKGKEFVKNDMRGRA